MNFINKYINGESATQYYYAEEFSEDNGPFTYMVGGLDALPFILKVDSNGNVVWEKSYELGTENGVVFIKIIRINAGNTDIPGGLEIGGIGDEGEGSWGQYILYGRGGNNEHWLVSIDESGKVNWGRRLYPDFIDVSVFLEPMRDDTGFYVVYATEEEESFDPPYIATFDTAGNFTNGQLLSLEGNTLIVKSVRSHLYGITLVGLNLVDGTSRGFLIDLDPVLNTYNALNTNESGVFFSDVINIDQFQYVVSGFAGSVNSAFIGGILKSGFSDVKYFSNVPSYPLRLCNAGDHFYMMQSIGAQQLLHRILPDFSIEWTKALEFTVAGLSFGSIYPLNYNAEFSTITAITYHQYIHQALVHTDDAFNSCKTIELDSPALLPLSLSASGIIFSQPWANLSYKDTEIEAITGQPSVIKCCSATGGGIGIDASTSIQSPSFYLQCAGSTGADGTTKGIHLRWLFAGALGQKHLPKGNYATTSVNFNKPDDYVKIYRAPYIKTQTILNLGDEPYLVDDGNKVWLYRVGPYVFYVYFRNMARYVQARSSYDPLTSPLDFIQAYGDALIEIENKKELFFAAELHTQNITQSASLKTETLSVAENALAVSRIISSRKTFTGNSLGDVRLVCENGRSIRFKPSNCNVDAVAFELYSAFIGAASQRNDWFYIDRYALSLSWTEPFERLEPAQQTVNALWPRYNDNEFVNISNYYEKWSGPRESWDRNIRTVVQQYITLSDAQDNPRAIEQVPLNSGGITADDNLEISNLNLLNIAAYDFHIARMLGVGAMDINTEVAEGQHIYIAEYITHGDLEDGGGARTVKHLAMGIPVGLGDQRLPLPVDLEELKPGAFQGSESPDPVSLTGTDGYTYDGRSRYVTIYSKEQPQDELNKPFYHSTREFNTSTFTYPVYAGIEYKKNNDTEWIKPELPNDPRYLNRVPANQVPHNETIPLLLPEPQKPLFVHRQNVSGTHYYSSYGINWFSRAVSSALTLSIDSDIRPANPLRPPVNINPLLVREESPLLLTSAEERTRYLALSGDRTMIRLTFDYHTFQEMVDYAVPADADINDPGVIPADNTEIYAEKVEVFFRNQVPGNVTGKALSVTDHPSNPILSVIQTGDFVQSSTGDILHPFIPPAAADNYVGGVFTMGGQQYIIHQVVLPTGAMQGPEFTVYKREISNGIVTNEIPPPGTQNLQSPVLIPDGLFMAVENMQNASSWGTPNPLSFKVNIGTTGWTVHRELITLVHDDGSTEQHLEKTRGFWDDAAIHAVNEPVTGGTAHKGMYKLEFQNLILPDHAQHNSTNSAVNSADWYQGIVRVHTVLNPDGQRKTLKVLRIDKNATTNKLELYAYDQSFDPAAGYDKIQTGTVSVNFYPGYKVYLFADAAAGLTEANILPAAGEGVHYSIFGLRSFDENDNYYSRISTPQLMFAQEQVAPIAPDQPAGPLYATRPDFFGRATYTLTARYAHKPYAVLFFRSDDEGLLNALYKEETITAIRGQLKIHGGTEDPYFANRWQNFLNFTALQTNGDYLPYPATGPDSYKFPHPDRPEFFTWANSLRDEAGLPPLPGAAGSYAAGDADIIEFVKGAVYSAFVPLTEVPVIHQYIRDRNYEPKPSKQVIRDRNGNVLKPEDPLFDISPMMKLTGGSGNETAFTDFSLDGTSNNIYFYGVRELNIQMKMSGFSPFLGPVRLVNTRPPEAPEIKRVMPVLEDVVQGIAPAVQLEINAYPEVQQVKKVTIYRAFNNLDAQSVRTMKPVKEIDLEVAGIAGNNVWQVEDKFDDLLEVPYNDGLYYRLTASRQVEYEDKNGFLRTEFAPSLPSKLAASIIAEVNNPAAPVMSFTSDTITAGGALNNVVLQWNKTAYKAKYHVYRMNSSGNWTKIYEATTNDSLISVPLAITDVQSGTIQTKDADGNNIYAHFKVVAENTSGMLSLEENILTIPVA